MTRPAEVDRTKQNQTGKAYPDRVKLQLLSPKSTFMIGTSEHEFQWKTTRSCAFLLVGHRSQGCLKETRPRDERERRDAQTAHHSAETAVCQADLPRPLLDSCRKGALRRGETLPTHGHSWLPHTRRNYGEAEEHALACTPALPPIRPPEAP